MKRKTRYSKPLTRTAVPNAAHVRDVFFDPTGRRWRRVQISLALLTLLTVIGITLAWQQLQQPPTIPGGGRVAPLPRLNLGGQTPIIGTGPLIRLVRVEHIGDTLISVDPISNQSLGTISGDDADQVGNATLAIQHYGYSLAAHKTLELTFDDGPDPTWTPKILDLLSMYKAAATFFVIGSEVVKYPDIVEREVREGFTVGNHTLTHPDLKPDEVEQQFVTNDRIIRATTGIATNLIRLPYDGNVGYTADLDRNAVLLKAEQLGYIVSMDEFDTNDWEYGDQALRPKSPIPLPPTTTDNLTILLHDGGGDRSETVAYLRRLLPWALEHGYSFHSLPQVSPQVMDGTKRVNPSLTDMITLRFYQALWVWPNLLIAALFVLAVLSVVVGSVVNVLLAVGRHFRSRRRSPPYNDGATKRAVSIAIAAYNEEKVIGKTLDSLCRSNYPNIREIIVVDDGSADRTANVVTAMAASEPRIRLLQQQNAGKAAALNRAFAAARSPIIVTFDADTIVTPTTVGNLARHFTVNVNTKQRLGAVAGVVKVGNRHNVLTRWQALEYITMIGVDRGAQDALHAIMVVPGACAAWSRKAVLRVGGYSRSTLAEDCDLALELQQSRYAVTQDDEAVTYTEAPETIGALARQRFRWMYGSIQAMWKHRRMILNPRYGWLGMMTLPLAVGAVLLPVLFLPFVYAMGVVSFVGQGGNLVLLYLVIFLVVQFVTAVVGIWLTREHPIHLLMVPLYRVIYEPLRAYILYKSILTILRGTRSGWNKLQRKGTVAAPTSNQMSGVA